MRRAVKIYPYFSEGLNSIGMILQKVNKVKAIDHFKLVLTIDPGNHKAILSMGTLLYEQKRFQEAGKYLKDYCIVSGAEETALKMYIDCLLKLGLKRTAKKELTLMLEKDPKNRYISNMFNDYMDKVAFN